MKPYYESGGITLYHGDCREVLPGLPAASVDLLIADPPYFRVKADWWDRQRFDADCGTGSGQAGYRDRHRGAVGRTRRPPSGAGHLRLGRDGGESMKLPKNEVALYRWAHADGSRLLLTTKRRLVEARGPTGGYRLIEAVQCPCSYQRALIYAGSHGYRPIGAPPETLESRDRDGPIQVVSTGTMTRKRRGQTRCRIVRTDPEHEARIQAHAQRVATEIERLGSAGIDDRSGRRVDLCEDCQRPLRWGWPHDLCADCRERRRR